MIEIKVQVPGLSDRRGIPTHPLTRDVLIVVAIKLVVVVAAALFVFDPRQRPKLDAGSVETRLTGLPDVSPRTRNPAP